MGFEPTVRFHVHTLSRRASSATPAPLRVGLPCGNRFVYFSRRLRAGNPETDFKCTDFSGGCKLSTHIQARKDSASRTFFFRNVLSGRSRITRIRIGRLFTSNLSAPGGPREHPYSPAVPVSYAAAHRSHPDPRHRTLLFTLPQRSRTADGGGRGRVRDRNCGGRRQWIADRVCERRAAPLRRPRPRGISARRENHQRGSAAHRRLGNRGRRPAECAVGDRGPGRLREAAGRGSFIMLEGFEVLP